MGVTNFDEVGVKKPNKGILTVNPIQPAIADITTDMSADVNDNELKNKINEILAALRNANIIQR
ncbi:hypothetical protein BSNK01_11920 [Bacillaceae bacterium]